MRANSSLSGVHLICLTHFLILSIFVGTLTARVLEESPQTAAPGGEQSKGQVNPSSPRQQGSATGDTTPTGTVQMPPSTTSTRLAYASLNASAPDGSSYYYRSSTVTTTHNGTFTWRQNTSGNVWESSGGTTSGGSGMANNPFLPPPPPFPNMFLTPPPVTGQP